MEDQFQQWRLKYTRVSSTKYAESKVNEWAHKVDGKCRNVPVYVVQTGHSMNEREIGRAKHWVSPYKFDKPIKPEEAPPFPSAPTYDAKAWPFIKEHAKPQSLFWNVGA